MAEKYNLEICPNCLEPNEEDLALCKNCGMPLHKDAEAPAEAVETESEALPEAPAEAGPEEEKKREKSAFSRAMPYLGLYVIYVAVTQFIEVKNNTDPAAGDPKLGYLSCVIYMVAGILMVYPGVRDWLNKRKEAKMPQEPTETAGTDGEENGE